MPTTPGSAEFRPVSVPEQPPQPEKGPDVSFEQGESAPEQPVTASAQQESAPAPAPIAVPAPSAPAPVQKDAEQMSIERHLEENLWDIYRSLDAKVRDRFKVEGENVAVTLRAAIGTPKMKPNFALKLILSWLRIIPKVNKFFLEQEAKIKTDNVMEVDREFREKNGL